MTQEAHEALVLHVHERSVASGEAFDHTWLRHDAMKRVQPLLFPGVLHAPQGTIRAEHMEVILNGLPDCIPIE